MKIVTEAGGIICPATPSFYSKPSTFEDMASTAVDRVLDLIGLEIKKSYPLEHAGLSVFFSRMRNRFSISRATFMCFARRKNNQGKKN